MSVRRIASQPEPRKQPSTRKVANTGGVSRLAGSLSPGDVIEYSITGEIKNPRQGNWWLKAGASTAIRDGEDAITAKQRLKRFVHDMLDESAKEILS